MDGVDPPAAGGAVAGEPSWESSMMTSGQPGDQRAPCFRKHNMAGGVCCGDTQEQGDLVGARCRRGLGQQLWRSHHRQFHSPGFCWSDTEAGAGVGPGNVPCAADALCPDCGCAGRVGVGVGVGFWQRIGERG